MNSLKKFLKEKGYVCIPMTLTITNHFEINAEINNILGKFIMDTGASNTCIGIDKVTHFNLSLEESEIKAAGAGAINMETQISNKNGIRIGKWVKKRQEIVVFDLSHVNQALLAHDAEPVDGIIGADILKKAKAVIDYDKRCIYLKK